MNTFASYCIRVFTIKKWKNVLKRILKCMWQVLRNACFVLVSCGFEKFDDSFLYNHADIKTCL